MSSRRGHVAIVLAAGGSRRLGRAKQLLTRDGETLLHRTVCLAIATDPDRVLVVVGARRGEMLAAMRDLACEPVFNAEWEAGIASSLRIAATALQGTSASTLILGCDQPALRHDHLQHLLFEARTSASACSAAAYAGVVGIPAVVSADLLARAGDLVGDRGLGQLLRALPPRSLARVDAPELALDLDTDADCATAVALGLLDPVVARPA